MENPCISHEKDIQSIKEEIDKIHDNMFKMNTLEKKVDKILYYLESDAATNQKGLVEKTEHNAYEIYKINNKIGIWEAKASVFGLVGGAIFTFLLWLANLLK